MPTKTINNSDKNTEKCRQKGAIKIPPLFVGFFEGKNPLFIRFFY